SSFSDIEPLLQSLAASPVALVYLIDHSDKPHLLESELVGLPALRYHRHVNNGYGGGHNYAIRMAIEAGSDFHLVVNPDVWFGPEVVPQLVAFMQQHSQVGMLMPKVCFPNGSLQPLVKLLPTPLDLFGRFCLRGLFFGKRNARFELRHSGYSFPINAPYLSGCFMFLRLSALAQVGLFDERYFMYAEDIDLTRRMHRCYQTIFYPSVTIYHRFNRQSRRSLRLFFIHFTNIVRYFNRYGWFSDAERRLFNERCLAEVRAHVSQSDNI
ncbi:MAG: glycosyltransferase, partial [Bacteroidales bacterium]|nr:glycosyltransferase [Bacteroidales bacterium]